MAVLPSAAVVQENLTTTVAGQLQSRGGMRPVAFAGAAKDEILDFYPYEYEGKTYILALTPGGLVSLESPAYGPALAPREPALAANGSDVAVSYTFDYVAGDISSVTPDPPDPAEEYVIVFDGGAAGTSHEVYVDAQQQCATAGAPAALDGGSASTAQYQPVIEADDLCDV